MSNNMTKCLAEQQKEKKKPCKDEKRAGTSHIKTTPSPISPAPAPKTANENLSLECHVNNVQSPIAIWTKSSDGDWMLLAQAKSYAALHDGPNEMLLNARLKEIWPQIIQSGLSAALEEACNGAGYGDYPHFMQSKTENRILRHRFSPFFIAEHDMQGVMEIITINKITRNDPAHAASYSALSYKKKDNQIPQLSGTSAVSENLSSATDRQHIDLDDLIDSLTGSDDEPHSIEYRLEAREKDLMRALHELSYFKQALDHHSLVSITNASGEIIFANEKFCRISKYKREELIGQNHRIVKSGIHSREFYDHLWSTISQGSVWKGDICNRASDGSLYWVNCTIVPFLDLSGTPTHYVSIRTDITRRKSTEAKLMQAIHRAEMANAAKSRFLATMSHELRTPLNAIIGFSELILRGIGGSDLTEQDRDYTEQILKSGEHLLAIISDLLDMSQIDTGQINLNWQVIDIVNLLGREVNRLEPTAQKKNVVLNLNGPDKALYMELDPLRVSQIIINLLSNAIKFSPEGGNIAISLREGNGPMIEIAVSDEGPGIPPEDLKSVLEPFRQAKNHPGAVVEGTGLGLSIASQLADIMGGKLTLTSDLGKGTCVSVLLPKLPPMNDKND